MTAKTPRNVRRTEIPVDYVIADSNGNRASRRMAAREAKARARGRNTSHGTGGEPMRSHSRRQTPAVVRSPHTGQSHTTEEDVTNYFKGAARSLLGRLLAALTVLILLAGTAVPASTGGESRSTAMSDTRPVAGPASTTRKGKQSVECSTNAYLGRSCLLTAHHGWRREPA